MPTQSLQNNHLNPTQSEYKTKYKNSNEIENKAATMLLKAKRMGVFLNFTKEPVRVYIKVYVPKIFFD